MPKPIRKRSMAMVTLPGALGEYAGQPCAYNVEVVL